MFYLVVLYAEDEVNARGFSYLALFSSIYSVSALMILEEESFSRAAKMHLLGSQQTIMVVPMNGSPDHRQRLT